MNSPHFESRPQRSTSAPFTQSTAAQQPIQTKLGSSESDYDASHQRRSKPDHRATVQAHRLRTRLASTAIRYGAQQPNTSLRTAKTLLISAVLAAVLLAGTIGVATVIQML